jgi:tRNA pseudouridine synthase 10
VRAASQGAGFKFHAAGREDIDALMLGSGRPFVVEISEPRLRTLDLKGLHDEINSDASGKIEVEGLEMTNRERSQELKEAASDNVKEYNALIETEGNVTEQSLYAAQESLRNVLIEQRTPNRVAHRRSDLVRRKRIYEVRLTRREARLLEGFFRVQGGTYVKELISGDGGRTRPSLSELLGTNSTCVELNVVAVRDAETDHNA